MMKICMLETSPSGPLRHRREDLDFFFVTHDKENKNSLSYNPGFKWAENRNFLASNFNNNQYDYYWFTDYDVVYSTNTELNVVDQIKKDLSEYNPLVLVCDSQSKNYPKNGNLKVQSFLFSNNQMKIVHKSVLDLFFPMPTKYGCIWDTCHYFNVIESCLLGKVALTSNVFAEGIISDPKSQGNHQSMHKIHSDINLILKKDNNLSHQEFKSKYQSKSLKVDLKKDDIDIKEYVNSFLDIEKLNKMKLEL